MQWLAAELDTQGMIRATRMPLGIAAKGFVNVEEVDFTEKAIAVGEEGYYYHWWGGNTSAPLLWGMGGLAEIYKFHETFATNIHQIKLLQSHLQSPYVFHLDYHIAKPYHHVFFTGSIWQRDSSPGHGSLEKPELRREVRAGIEVRRAGRSRTRRSRWVGREGVGNDLVWLKKYRAVLQIASELDVI